MPRIRSLVIFAKPDEAKKSHGCHGNAQHRIKMGEKRLKVKNDRSWNHYCLKCARRIVEGDIVKLQKLAESLEYLDMEADLLL